jgi:quercetin dioxygenase-like cupin family protein
MGTIFNKGNTPLKLKHLALATLTALLSACSQSEAPKPVADPAAQAEIDSSIYFRGDDPTDPYRALYAEFRERRAADMANPELPKPLAHYQATHFTRNMDWSDLETVLPFEWGKLDPTKAQALKNAVKMRLAFDHPDLKIVQIMVGPGGVMPAHAGGAPGLYIGVGGTGEVTREGATQTLTPGTTVKLNPYDVRRVTANDGDTPLKLLWIRWAPGGDQAFIDAGYYLTGSNQHIQPETADMPLDYKFWGTVYDTKTLAAPSIPVITPSDGSFFSAQQSALQTARAELGDARDLYPTTPVFGHESDKGWLTVEQIKKGGFFFSKDAAKFGKIIDRMAAIARHKAIFRAVRRDGRWDFNISETSWGPRSTYVEHSHLTPEFYYMMSGPVMYGVDGKTYEAMTGDIIHNNSYSPHLAQGIVDDLVFDNFGSTWAPRGDRSVFGRPFYIVEPLPIQPKTARIQQDTKFH